MSPLNYGSYFHLRRSCPTFQLFMLQTKRLLILLAVQFQCPQAWFIPVCFCLLVVWPIFHKYYEITFRVRPGKKIAIRGLAIAENAGRVLDLVNIFVLNKWIAAKVFAIPYYYGSDRLPEYNVDFLLWI